MTIGAIGGDFANSGSLEATNGTVHFDGLIGGTFTNAAGGTITAAQLDIESGVGAAFENDGQVTLGGSGSSIGTSTIAVVLTNTGTIDVQAGTLSLSGGGSNDGGTITIESGAELDIESNFSLTSVSTLDADGDVIVGAISAPVTLTLEGGATITASGGIHGPG